MADKTQITTRFIADEAITRDLLNVSIPGQAVTARILEVAASGVKIYGSSGVDSGTGDVSLTLDFTLLDARWVGVNDSRLTDSRNAADVQPWAKALAKPSYSWSEIGSRPTALSAFTNDLGNYGGFLTGTPWTAVGYWYSANHPTTTFGYGLPDYPTTLPASDVSAWAKALVKPSYIWTEIGSRPTALSAFTNDLGNYGGFVTGSPWTAVGYAMASDLSAHAALTTIAHGLGASAFHTEGYYQVAGSYAPGSGSGNYIQNQNASAQSANMWISGSGTFNGDVSATSNNSGYSIRLHPTTTGDVELRTDDNTGSTYSSLVVRLGNGSGSYAYAGKFSNSGLDINGGISLPTGTTSANGIQFGSDVNLYRFTTDLLRTEDRFMSAGLTSYGDLDLATNPIYRAGVINSTVATGTAPLTVASTTLVTNLNSHYLNYQPSTYYENYFNSKNAQSVNGYNDLPGFGSFFASEFDGYIGGVIPNNPTSNASYYGAMINVGAHTDRGFQIASQYGPIWTNDIWFRTKGDVGYYAWNKLWNSGNLPNPTQGSGTTNYIPKWTGSGTLGDSPIYTNGTNVGIGTTAPGVKFAVQGMIQSQNSDWVLNTSGTSIYIAPGTASGETYGEISAVKGGNSIVTNIAINPYGGNVGIGTTNPQATLHLQGEFESTYALKIQGTYGTGRLYGWKTQGGNSDVLSLFDVTSGNRIMYIGNNSMGLATVGINRFTINDSGAATLSSLAGTGTRMVVTDSNGTLSSQTIPSGGGGGTVVSVGIDSANGFAGTSSGGTNPALSLSTTITGILKGNGTAILAAAVTGSGSVVLATSPILVTPALGTPSSGNLANCSFPTLNQNTTGSAGSVAWTGVSGRPTFLSQFTNDLGNYGSFLTASSLSGYATQSWVNAQGFVTGTPWTSQGYLTSSSLTGYATQAWVNAQGFVTGTPWTSQGYMTSSSLTGYATQTWANSNFLPLAGGTLSGGLAGTTVTMTGLIKGSEIERGSSRALKTNIKSFDINAIDYLNKIAIMSYNLKDGGLFGIGFVAEDTHWWLSGDQQKSHLFGNHLGVLTKAVQDEDKKVEELKKQVAELMVEIKLIQNSQQDARR